MREFRLPNIYSIYELTDFPFCPVVWGLSQLRSSDVCRLGALCPRLRHGWRPLSCFGYSMMRQPVCSLVFSLRDGRVAVLVRALALGLHGWKHGLIVRVDGARFLHVPGIAHPELFSVPRSLGSLALAVAAQGDDDGEQKQNQTCSSCKHSLHSLQPEAVIIRLRRRWTRTGVPNDVAVLPADCVSHAAHEAHPGLKLCQRDAQFLLLFAR